MKEEEDKGYFIEQLNNRSNIPVDVDLSSYEYDHDSDIDIVWDWIFNVMEKENDENEDEDEMMNQSHIRYMLNRIMRINNANDSITALLSCIKTCGYGHQLVPSLTWCQRFIQDHPPHIWKKLKMTIHSVISWVSKYGVDPNDICEDHKVWYDWLTQIQSEKQMKDILISQYGPFAYKCSVCTNPCVNVCVDEYYGFLTEYCGDHTPKWCRCTPIDTIPPPFATFSTENSKELPSFTIRNMTRYEVCRLAHAWVPYSKPGRFLSFGQAMTATNTLRPTMTTLAFFAWLRDYNPYIRVEIHMESMTYSHAQLLHWSVPSNKCIFPFTMGTDNEPKPRSKLPWSTVPPAHLPHEIESPPSTRKWAPIHVMVPFGIHDKTGVESIFVGIPHEWGGPRYQSHNIDMSMLVSLVKPLVHSIQLPRTTPIPNSGIFSTGIQLRTHLYSYLFRIHMGDQGVMVTINDRGQS